MGYGLSVLGSLTGCSQGVAEGCKHLKTQVLEDRFQLIHKTVGWNLQVLTGCWTESFISCQLSATLSSLPCGTLHRAARNKAAGFHSTSERW